jgi:hypothetical protein
MSIRDEIYIKLFAISKFEKIETLKKDVEDIAEIFAKRLEKVEIHNGAELNGETVDCVNPEDIQSLIQELRGTDAETTKK